MNEDQIAQIFGSLGEIRGELKGMNKAMADLTISVDRVNTNVKATGESLASVETRTERLESDFINLRAAMPHPKKAGSIWRERGAFASIGVGLGAAIAEILARIFSGGGPK
jgi:hypothetical protein